MEGPVRGFKPCCLWKFYCDISEWLVNFYPLKKKKNKQTKVTFTMHYRKYWEVNRGSVWPFEQICLRKKISPIYSSYCKPTAMRWISTDIYINGYKRTSYLWYTWYTGHTALLSAQTMEHKCLGILQIILMKIIC